MNIENRLRFTEHADLDVVESFTDQVVLESEHDVEQWAAAVEEWLARRGGKVWLLIDLDGLVVRPTASAAFGRRRAEVLERYTHASVRYGGEPWTRVSVNESAARYRTHGHLFTTRDEALRFLLALRDEVKRERR